MVKVPPVMAASKPLDSPIRILPVKLPPEISMLARGALLPGFCVQMEQLPPTTVPPVTFTVLFFVVLLAN